MRAVRAHPSMRGPSRSCNVPLPRAAPPSRSISMAVNRPSTMLTKTSAPPPPPSSYLRTIVPRSVTLQSRVPSSYPLPTKTSPILPPHFLTSSIFERRQISLPSSPFNVRLPKEIHDLPPLVDIGITYDLLSTKRRRVRKMARHQYRKRLKKLRLEQRKVK